MVMRSSASMFSIFCAVHGGLLTMIVMPKAICSHTLPANPACGKGMELSLRAKGAANGPEVSVAARRLA